MIKILIRTEENSFKSLEVKGHANSAEYGKDLICAAVSTVMTGGMNALKDKEYDFKLEEGHIYVKALDIPSDYDSVVLKTMEVQLMTIEESNHKYVQIENL